MACEYYVNGAWISETKFKTLLNNGLLDNLIDDETITLEGFKVREENIILPATSVFRRDIIPAKKLAEILTREVSTRQGYPLNMLSALELNDNGTDFKIPLWASPYASKFESLLTSLVNNKVVKQKFPGHSYVLGSEEGFRVKEGEEANLELAKSGIVFSKNFDPSKGLQPMRYDSSTKKILPAQIMIPFKFRDNNGKILDLEQFVVEDETGKKIIDTTKIPQKVLNLFGFRIPTQERNSMAAVEIVGFLPEASGDLVLAPRDFTKQMGSDFDVDKLYTYMYNTFYKNGKLYTNFLSNKDSIKKKTIQAKKRINKIKQELELSSEEQSLLNDYINQKLDYTEDEEIPSEYTLKASEFLNTITSTSYKQQTQDLLQSLDEAYEDLAILNRSYKASRQNNILDIHLKVMTSNNPEVISSIMALDSFGEFEDLSKEIYKTRLSRGLIPQTSTILSETYQRTKYVNATAGKAGVGTFSLDSTFNASAQGKDLVYLNLDDDGRKYLKRNPTIDNKKLLELNNPITSFGNIVSKGDMSNKYTLRSQQIIARAKAEGRALTQEEKDSIKLKSTIIRSLQSSAVDNEKAQILDKLNINNETFDTIRALTILGFEEEDIVGLLTQEIVWEYIDELKNAQSSLNEYNPNASQDIVAKLRTKYDPSNRYDELEEDEILEFSSISSKELLDNIKNKSLIVLGKDSITPDFNIQQLVLLDKFLELQTIGKTIQQVQSAINTESKGIPKSLLEVQNKVYQISTLPINIYNIKSLIGSPGIEPGSLIPKTINGYAATYGLQFANKIFSNYFPYQRQGFKTVVDEIASYIPNQELSPSQQVKLVDDILDNMKSFLFSNPDTGLYTENANIERRRLFIDSETNTSLASILSSLSEQPWFTQNGFLNKLTFDLNKNGDLSRIFFEAATGENFDERNIYLGFLYLLDKNFEIGTFNGQKYTTRTLAQELIAAAFLEGGNQGAKQYLKYIPISYLKTLEFGNYLKSIDFDFQNLFGGIIINDQNSYLYPSNFTRQFFQNNPERVKTITTESIQGFDKSKGNPSRFKLTKEGIAENLVFINDPETGDEIATQTQFVSIYDNKENGKYALYEFDSATREYIKIPVLKGNYGFVQYDPQLTSNSNVEVSHPNYIQPEEIQEEEIIVNENRIEKFEDLNIRLNLSNKEALDNLLNSLELSSSVYSYNRKLIEEFRNIKLPANFKLKYIQESQKESKASYNSATNTLLLNISQLRDLPADELATVVLHELTHTFTSDPIKKYESGNLESLSQEQIASIKKLESLQKQYVNYLVETGDGKGLTAFFNTYHNWRYERGMISKEVLDNLIAKGPKGIDSNFQLLPEADFSKESQSKYYGAIKLTEFVSMALTDRGFQEQLNNVIDKDGRPFWSKIVDSLVELLQSLGLNIKPNSLLASALEESMSLIQKSQRKGSNLNLTQEDIDRMSDPDNLAQDYLLPEDFPLSPSEYEKYLLICGK